MARGIPGESRCQAFGHYAIHQRSIWRPSAHDISAHLVVEFMKKRKPELALGQVGERTCLPSMSDPLHEARSERESHLAGLGDDIITYPKPEEPVIAQLRQK